VDDLAKGYAMRDNLVVPGHEVWFEFSHASGPGGQNVNKVETVATLCFAPAASGVLSDAEKRLVAARLANRIGADGVLRVTSRESRSQSGNRATASERFCLLIREGLKKPKRRIATKPSRASRQRRLDDKAHHSRVKAARRMDAADGG
jgi:ribosome-associated protein